LGNIQVNGMASGYYELMIFKSFEMLVVNSENNETIGRLCAIVSSIQPVIIEPGTESVLDQPVSDFSLDVYPESCSGSSALDIRNKKKASTGKSSGLEQGRTETRDGADQSDKDL
jgi:hypothetical protein